MWCLLSWGECDYPNLGMCGGLLAQILILLQIPFVHLVKQKSDRRQLIKVGAVTQNYLWSVSLGTVDPLPHFRPWDESTVSRLSLPSIETLCRIVEMLHRISMTSLLPC